MSRVVLAGGTILTGDPARPRVRAVAIQGGLIVALDEDALDLAGGADKVDLAGRTLVPGFHDGHIHPLWGGAQLQGAPIAEVRSLDELLAALAGFAHQHPERAWITGFGYPPPLLTRGLGDAALLDRVVPDRPVALTASDGHTMWVNTAALAAAGITASTPDPPLGAIARREDGSPLGTLLEAATDLIDAVVPPTTSAEKRMGALSAMQLLARAGITWVQDAMNEPDDVDVYLALAREGLATARVNAALRALPGEWEDQRPGFRSARERGERAATSVTARTIKYFADGIIESGTAALLDPYCDGSAGIANWSDEELAAAVTALDGDGFQTHIHAIGDAGVRLALDAIETAARRNGTRDRRPVIAHTQLVHPDDHDRFAALGVIANFEPLWAQLDPLMLELTIDRLGPERSAWQYPIASMVRSGATVTFGSDWPVSSMVPMEGLAVAVTRQTSDGDPPGGWLPEQRIDLATGLRAYTAAGAFQAFADGEQGRIAEGFRADLVVLDGDLDTVPPAEIAQIKVETTYLDGKTVYQRS